MKDMTAAEMDDGSRPTVSLEDAVRHALAALFKDEEHRFTEQIVKGLTFEELIGTLLLARDAAQQIDALSHEVTE